MQEINSVSCRDTHVYIYRMISCLSTYISIYIHLSMTYQQRISREMNVEWMGPNHTVRIMIVHITTMMIIWDINVGLSQLFSRKMRPGFAVIDAPLAHVSNVRLIIHCHWMTHIEVCPAENFANDMHLWLIHGSRHHCNPLATTASLVGTR